MKLIIDIPEDTVTEIKDNAMFAKEIASQIKWDVTSAIVNGKPFDDVLSNLRAEIQENINYNKKMNYQGIVAGLLLTLDIIDKYRNEVNE